MTTTTACTEDAPVNPWGTADAVRVSVGDSWNILARMLDEIAEPEFVVSHALLGEEPQDYTLVRVDYDGYETPVLVARPYTDDDADAVRLPVLGAAIHIY